MRILGVVVLVLVSSCVRTSTVTCGELTCEAGSVCSPTGGFCTTQAQVDACVDADTPATTCTAPGERPGVCRDGFCQEVRCGDLRRDPGEVCDDGNFIAGDACSPDCTSDESCGNDVLDRGTEECDDGNAGSHDGCSASCRTESPIWRQVIDKSFPPRIAHAMVYDVARKRIVLFGGRTVNLSNETWEFDGLAWTRRTPAASPSAREHPAMAYDAVRQRTVLFGGSNDSGLLDDTWEWDGTTWSMKSPATKPSPRSGSGMAFHPGRSVVVLHGGAVDQSTAGDTWEYNGTNWVNQTGAGTPGKSAQQPIVYDPFVGGIVTFGSDSTTQTWKYNGTWSELTMTGITPRPRAGFTLTFDASTGHTIMIGGSDGGCGVGTNCSDTFELFPDQGSPGSFLWNNVGGQYAPTFGAAAYDTDTSQLVVMGGQLAGTNNAAEDATWTRTAGYWSRLERPSPRYDCQLAYLPALNGTVLFGGSFDSSTSGADTWLLRDGHWSPLHPSVSPPPTSNRAMVLDRARNKLVLVDAAGATWEFDGTTWTPITTATSPPLRTKFRLVYDDARSAVVLFGGYEPVDKVPLADTWTYDGTNWTQLATTIAPPPRSGHAMSYDRKHDRIVVFGGSADTATWELSGTTWTQVTGTGANPTVRSTMPMVFDPKRASSVLFGGSSVLGVVNDETWELVDGAWRQSTSVAPPARASHCSTYDETLEKTVIVAGTGASALLSDTWLFGYE